MMMEASQVTPVGNKIQNKEIEMLCLSSLLFLPTTFSFFSIILL